jgi:hypothetical protein
VRRRERMGGERRQDGKMKERRIREKKGEN